MKTPTTPECDLRRTDRGEGDPRGPSRAPLAGLGVVMGLFLCLSGVGIRWGLPTRMIDPFLFSGEPWPGEKIHRLAGAGEKFDPSGLSGRGADVDVDPLAGAAPGGMIDLAPTDEDAARVYLRYRLYTHQPDEMITMMALAGMRPGQLDFDPRLYQYGGLFIYPVGALIRLCGWAGLIDVRGDVIYYLDRPDEFGKFYVVARAYSAAWGLLGVLLVFAVTLRIAESVRGAAGDQAHGENENGDRPGNSSILALFAALLFTFLPVVVCMSHEGKPHLPGAVLMLAAVYFAIRSASPKPLDSAPPFNCEAHGGRSFWLMSASCGAAVGMVLSSWPIGVLIPITAAWRQGGGRFLRWTLLGSALAVAVYLASNPYILINAFAHRDVLRSNFGNSLAMYEIDRIGEGFLRVLDLTLEGATLPVALLGVIGFGWVVTRAGRGAPVWMLLIPAVLFFAQFVLIGAGKPAEYGRFGIFMNTALVIATACVFHWPLLSRHWMTRFVLPVLVLSWTAMFGAGYLRNFHRDTTDQGSRIRLAKLLVGDSRSLPAAATIVLFAEPAPYSCPPLDFSNRKVLLVRGRDGALPKSFISIRPIDGEEDGGAQLSKIMSAGHGIWCGWNRPTPISWANKPFLVEASEGTKMIVPSYP